MPLWYAFFIWNFSNYYFELLKYLKLSYTNKVVIRKGDFIMKWLKEKFVHLFTKDDEEDLIIDDSEIEYEEEYPQHVQPTQPLPQRNSSFRFPLISNEEEMQENLNNDYETSLLRKEQEGFFDQMEPLQSMGHKSHIDTRIYEVEESGIRDLLANRGKHARTERIIRSNRTETVEIQPVHRPHKKSEQMLASLKEEIPLPPQNRRRFVPTNVPSPVYGFQKPTPIDSLLAKKRHEEHEKSEMPEELSDQHEVQEASIIKESMQNHQEEKSVEQGLVVSQETVKENEREILLDSTVVSNVESTITTENVNEYVDDRVEESVIERFVSHVEETQNESVHIENVPVEDNYSKIKDEEDVSNHVVALEQEQISESEMTHHEEKISPEPLIQERSRIPFNVLMLRTDKEKLSAKISRNQLEDAVNTQVPNIQQIEQEVAITTEKDTLQSIRVQPVEQTVKQVEVLPDNMNTNQTVDSAPHIEIQQALVQQAQPKVSEPITKELESVLIEEQTKHPIKIYTKPSMDLLELSEEKIEDTEWMESQADKLVEALSYFQVSAQVESIKQGPAVTQFEITVSHGTKVSKIRNLADDLKLALAAKDIRIQAPIPGKSSIGIEIPNRKSRAVRLSEVTSSEAFLNSESPLEAALGLDLTGKPVTIDLRKMPHGLIAGATGSGKSVCINSILVSLLYKAAPHELKLMLIDPKMVELAPFNHIPHLVSPVITDVKAATAALKWAVEEMERRYQLFASAGVRDLPRYNKLADSKGQYGLKLPYILIVIDELADLMMMSPADVEEAICRIAQKARACGIHLIVATQRPSVDVITGLIKSNIPTRIAFAVSSQIDSRTILDTQGAERLLGRGDMLYLGNGMSDSVRIQGTFVTDDEIEAIVEHVREQGEPDYFFNQEELLRKTEISEDQDDLFEEVCRFVYEQGSASTSLVQRKYHIGYNRAARLIDMLEQHGFVSEQRGSKAREVYITESDLIELFE